MRLVIMVDYQNESVNDSIRKTLTEVMDRHPNVDLELQVRDDGAFIYANVPAHAHLADMPHSMLESAIADLRECCVVRIGGPEYMTDWEAELKVMP